MNSVCVLLQCVLLHLLSFLLAWIKAHNRSSNASQSVDKNSGRITATCFASPEKKTRNSNQMQNMKMPKNGNQISNAKTVRYNSKCRRSTREIIVNKCRVST
ncbi:hypothetical protein niasHS_007702 [Heterodera schachtii]|uniref:Secreted protein n=1 Tax=Heterodera schachtii TaxID=97005 RepID=A0ABD2JPG8_HETSC